ncbi:hypothetical protein FRC12_020913 [Ceratobasidium sp. 428]|nr:hypothetical protein FRC12_020913 [Ceratobasidium sp. 428]
MSLFESRDPVLGVFVKTVLPMPNSNWLDILNQLLQTTGPMTMLKLYRTLHKMQLQPATIREHWLDVSLPALTVLAGDVGIYLESPTSNWLNICGDTSVNDMPGLNVRERGGLERFTVTTPITGSDGWLMYEMPFSSVNSVSWSSEMNFSPEVWQNIVRQWTHPLRLPQEQVDLETISLCNYVFCLIEVTNRETTLPDSVQIYYHRSPVAQSDPRSFWGYFSTSRDPQARDGSLEDLGWTLRYWVSIDIWRIVDDWGYKHRKLLAESLRNMPGSFATEATEDDHEE